MILAKYVSSLLVMCINIPVKGPSFEDIVRHVSSLTSFSVIVELRSLFQLKNNADNVFSSFT